MTEGSVEVLPPKKVIGRPFGLGVGSWQEAK